MSTCISRAGEYSEHETEPGNYICDRCGVLDDDGLFAELEELRAKVATLTEEWTVRHAQGVHPGPFTECSARQWMADNIARDPSRRPESRGQQRLLRRLVTPWEETP